MHKRAQDSLEGCFAPAKTEVRWLYESSLQDCRTPRLGSWTAAAHYSPPTGLLQGCPCRDIPPSRRPSSDVTPRAYIGNPDSYCLQITIATVEPPTFPQRMCRRYCTLFPRNPGAMGHSRTGTNRYHHLNPDVAHDFQADFEGGGRLLYRTTCTAKRRGVKHRPVKAVHMTSEPRNVSAEGLCFKACRA